ANGAQSPRVPVSFLEDPYEAIRQAYLVEAETPESPHTVASSIPLLDSTPPTRHAEDSVDSDTSGARSTPSDSIATLLPDHPLTHALPTLVPILRRTARMVVRGPPTMSLGLSASIAEVAAMSDSAFLEDDEEEEEDDEEEDDEEEDDGEEDDKEEDEEIEERDEGLAAGDEGPGMRVENLSLRGDEAVPEEPERPERVSALRQPTLTTWIDPEDDRVYIDVPAYPPTAPPVQTPPSPKWSSGLLHVSSSPSIFPSPISSPMIPLIVASPIASPATAETEGFLTELGSRVEMQGGLIHDHLVRLGELSPALFERYDRAIRELFTRSGAGQTDAQRAALWHAISDTQMENRELRLQIAEERCARLDLAEIVDSVRRGQEPRGDVYDV
ncbi:hypothetical protein Tco_0311478, partial [Tanacetum coccineum]